MHVRPILGYFALPCTPACVPIVYIAKREDRRAVVPMQRIMRRKVALTLGFLLAGCAARSWDKPGATQTSYNEDSYACEKDVRQSGHFGGGLAGVLSMRDMYARCMQAHGWAETPSGQGFQTSTPP